MADGKEDAVAPGHPVLIPKKLGLVLKPPSLVLLYESGGKRLRKRSLPLRFPLKASTDPRAKAEELKLRHLSFLERVPTVIVTKLISIAQEVQGGRTLEDSIDLVTARFTLDKDKDLNRVSQIELSRQKDLMELSFLSHAVDSKHPAFIYDKQVEFNQPSTRSNWDDDQDDDDW